MDKKPKKTSKENVSILRKCDCWSLYKTDASMNQHLKAVFLSKKPTWATNHHES